VNNYEGPVNNLKEFYFIHDVSAKMTSGK